MRYKAKSAAVLQLALGGLPRGTADLNGHRPWSDRICRMIDRPIVGSLCHSLNVNLIIRFMAAGHVYSDPIWLRGEAMRDKLNVTRARGARFSSVRFVTGKLDPLATRAEFLDLAQRSRIPTRRNAISLICGNGSACSCPWY